VVDATESVITAPASDLELESLSFSEGAGLWLSQPVTQFRKNHKIIYNQLTTSVLEACAKSQVSLVKIEPEEVDFEARYFVMFDTRPTIAFRLDLTPPDWIRIESRCGFSVSPAFISFAEKWPGLIIGSFDFPAFLLSPVCWLDHKLLLSYDGQCQPTESPELIRQLKGFLLFQVDYWSKAKLLDASGDVWEYSSTSKKLTRTEFSFDIWLEMSLRKLLSTPPND